MEFSFCINGYSETFGFTMKMSHVYNGWNQPLTLKISTLTDNFATTDVRNLQQKKKKYTKESWFFCLVSNPLWWCIPFSRLKNPIRKRNFFQPLMRSRFCIKRRDAFSWSLFCHHFFHTYIRTSGHFHLVNFHWHEYYTYICHWVDNF